MAESIQERFDASDDIITDDRTRSPIDLIGME